MKQTARRFLPKRIRHRIKKWYYPRVVRRFDPGSWPCSEIARALVRTGDQVVDVGANIGYVTRMFSEWVGEAGCVHAFEPVPETFDLLRHNMHALHLSNVRLYPYAASDGRGSASMGIPEYDEGGENLYESHLIRPDASAADRERHVSVERRTLDECLCKDRSASFSLVKIDVEGHELEAVRGAAALIETCMPPLVIEVNGDPDAPGSSAADLFALVEGCGYLPHVFADAVLRERRSGMYATDYIFLVPRHIECVKQAGVRVISCG